MGELPLPSIYVGEILMIAGEAFRLWGVFTLGKHFSPIVTIYSYHRVVGKGHYK
jgi:protein-S-isoprenylcysteine O-methyltransferase Ste14